MPNIPPPPPSSSERFDDWLVKLHQGVAKRVNWTPVLSFATPGDSVIALSTAVGELYYSGGLYTATFNCVTSTFTHTTSAGDLSITGLPVTSSSDTNYTAIGCLQWNGITKANYTQWMCFLSAGVSAIKVLGQGSGVTDVVLNSTDLPTAGLVILRGTIQFR